MSNALTADQNKKNTLFLVLSCVFLTNAIIAEFGGVKIFSLEKLLNIQPLNLSFLGSVISFNMSVGVLIWPFVFILSDIMNEYFGKQGVRKISFITAAMIGYGFVIILGWTKMPPADFWLQLNGQDAQLRPFDINFAYSTIFRQGLGIIVGSLTAFLLSQLIDAHVFHFFRKLTGHRFLWLRATGSTVISQLIDSFVILIIAFYLLGNWSLDQVLKVGLVQYIYKVMLAIGLTPVIYLVHFVIDRYLGKEESISLIEKTNESW
jgi:uncharacterized integral membrane protein (TIGR00697 family)